MKPIKQWAIVRKDTGRIARDFHSRCPLIFDSHIDAHMYLDSRDLSRIERIEIKSVEKQKRTTKGRFR